MHWEDSEYRGNSQSLNSRAFRLFKEDKDLRNVAIALDIETDDILGFYNGYLRLLNLETDDTLLLKV